MNTSITRSFFAQVGFAAVGGGLTASFVAASQLDKSVEALITFVAIVVAAAVSCLVLTANAPRPKATSVADAKRFGLAVKNQVLFWNSYVVIGVITVFILIFSRLVGWGLPIPRPNFIPEWVPYSDWWLKFVSIFLLLFLTLRMKYIKNGIISLVSVGNDLHVHVVEQEIASANANRRKFIEEQGVIDPERGRAVVKKRT